MLVAIFVSVAAPWLFLVAYAESHCPVIRDAILSTSSRCGEGDGPLWFLAMVTSQLADSPRLVCLQWLSAEYFDGRHFLQIKVRCGSLAAVAGWLLARPVNPQLRK
jgi:hypothetical protein